jgi:23S rRNA-/tRNA-specific pseudouridylate synthase
MYGKICLQAKSVLFFTVPTTGSTRIHLLYDGNCCKGDAIFIRLIAPDFAANGARFSACVVHRKFTPSLTVTRRWDHPEQRPMLFTVRSFFFGIQKRYHIVFATGSMSNNTVTIQPDNPCWGSLTQCNLMDLLSKFSKETTVIYETSQYVVINKPPDLRMDGPYPATVHKLLTYWYPPPSIAGNGDLIKAVSELHQYNALDDNNLRPCHQLDYATSGLLCIARTHAAAHHASRQWEERKVTKEYLAVLNGQFAMDITSLPQFSSHQIRATLQSLEHNYKKAKRPNRKTDTFQGFQPPFALFQKYKSSCERKPTPKKTKRPRPERLSDDQWTLIWKPVKEVLEGSGEPSNENHKNNNNELIQKMNWKTLCRENLQWKEAFEKAAEIHNTLLRESLQNDETIDPDCEISFPMLFGEKVEDPSDTSSSCSMNQNVVYISCPLAADPNDFSMKVPPEILQTHPHMKPFVGSPDLDYKPSLTKCTILSRGDTTTKVHLVPLTGRRHQLRVHMALVMPGKGIVGDATYNPLAIVGDQEGPSTTSSTRSTTSQQRMCLHSHKLSLSLLMDDGNQVDTVNLVAPDPF